MAKARGFHLVNSMIEITAWAVILHLMANVGEMFLTIMAIGQNIYAVIAFAVSGLQKAITIISSNLFGAKNYKKIQKTYFSAVKLLLIFALVLSSILIIYPNFLIDAFLAKEKNIEDISQMFSYLRITCIFLWVYFILDGFTWITAGILTAKGDTIFIMLMNAIGAWLFALLPVYFFIIKNPSSPIYVWALMDFYGLMNAICFYLRYKFKKLETSNKIS
jgi:MATE family multidrug resistance protein